MVKSLLKIIGVFILGIGGGIFADQVLQPYFFEKPFFYQYRSERGPGYFIQEKEIRIQENTALKDAIEKVEKTVVGLKGKKGKVVLEGSGLILTSDGLVVTLAELLPPGANMIFFRDNKSPLFQILKRDPTNNLALVKIEESNLPTAKLADLEKMRLGERVFLLGIISGPSGFQKIVNEGIVTTFTSTLIQTNISEKSNLRGSPLFDIEGNVLGLNFIDLNGKINTIPITKIKEFAGI